MPRASCRGKSESRRSQLTVGKEEVPRHGNQCTAVTPGSATPADAIAHCARSNMPKEGAKGGRAGSWRRPLQCRPVLLTRQEYAHEAMLQLRRPEAMQSAQERSTGSFQSAWFWLARSPLTAKRVGLRLRRKGFPPAWPATVNAALQSIRRCPRSEVKEPLHGDPAPSLSRTNEPERRGVLAELLSGLPAPAVSGESTDPARIERGRTLIRKHRCNVCHNADLAGRENVSRIAGQREDYLLKVLRGYKDNSRPGYDASMGEALQPVTDEEIRDLAYFAARQP